MFESFFEMLVTSNASIETQYLFYSQMKPRNWWEKAVWIVFLNWHERVLRRPMQITVPLEIRQRVYAQPNCDDMLKRLLQYEVISFDVFDTLLLRAATSPKQVFVAMEDVLHLEGFAAARITGETLARLDHKEVKLSDIYRHMPQEFWGVEGQELAFEGLFCSANPYWKEILPKLLSAGKRVVLTSDMYLSSKEIRNLFLSCGIPGVDAIYVSCEQGCSKSQGDLFQRLLDKERVVPKRLIHIGDNYQSDVQSPRSHGIQTYYYRNVHAGGNIYQGVEAPSLCGSLYNGVLDICLHSGLPRDGSYLLGFCCYGPFCLLSPECNNDDLPLLQKVLPLLLQQHWNGLNHLSQRAKEILTLPFKTWPVDAPAWESLWHGLQDFFRVHPGMQYKLPTSTVSQIIERLYDMISYDGELL